jgi:plasmid stabilization system protein ParE
MKQYAISVSNEADSDIDAVYDYIASELMAPQTAIDYRNGIHDTIAKLIYLGGILAINSRDYVQAHWGPDARTISYKNMTIIYNLIGDTVLVRRVIASSMVL